MIPLNKTIYRRINLALLFFVISAFYGFFLRWQKVQAVFSFAYADVMQAHSHVTFLGWGFLASITIITVVFIPIQQVKLRKKSPINPLFAYSFWIMATSIMGMLISFPLQGYKFFSIAFLSFFLIASYVYLFLLYKQVSEHKTYSARFIRAGIIYYYLSSLAIWAISIITVTIGRGELYQIAISFYTHFLYNGFFVMVLFGLFVRYIEFKKIAIPEKYINAFFNFTNLAILPTFALSLLDKPVPIYIVIIGFIGASLQLISLFYLWKINKKLLQKKAFNKLVLSLLFWVIILSYALKILMQFLGAFPALAKIAMQYKPFFIIGYIHLFTLGFMSLFLFLLLKILLHINLSKWGIYLLIIGFIITEITLFLQGLLISLNRSSIENFDKVMFIHSILMPLGVLVVYLSVVFKKIDLRGKTA